LGSRTSARRVTTTCDVGGPTGEVLQMSGYVEELGWEKKRGQSRV